jgi:hypothetical protein
VVLDFGFSESPAAPLYIATRPVASCADSLSFSRLAYIIVELFVIVTFAVRCQPPMGRHRAYFFGIKLPLHPPSSEMSTLTLVIDDGRM